MLAVISCDSDSSQEPTKPDLKAKAKFMANTKNVLSLEQANRLAQLPLECMQTEFPNKLGQTLGNASELKTPKTLHPAFYGCFDWHSAVHGHWSLVYLLKKYPKLDKREEVLKKLRENISCLLYTSPSPRDATLSRMPSSA